MIVLMGLTVMLLSFNSQIAKNGSSESLPSGTLQSQIIVRTNLGSSNTVTLTVNDGHGNSNTCQATVTVQIIHHRA